MNTIMLSENLVKILQFYFISIILIMVIYAFRQHYLAFNRLCGRQKFFYEELEGGELPSVSVLVPMHNEEQVAGNVLDALLKSTYPRDKFEIIAINDHSEDKTKEIIDNYSARYDTIKPFHRYHGRRGKPIALNEAISVAQGDIVIVFDADYLPGPGLVALLSKAFWDPSVGAVMGRVIPENVNVNLLTRLLDLERSGGYQVDQQARYNLGLLPQYGGTVGGFRRELVIAEGGFNPQILAEDTELTCRLFCKGWQVVYANIAECYEQLPTSWKARGIQIKRWSRGHNQCLWRYIIPFLKSLHLSWRQKLDGVLMLGVYLVPTLLLIAMLDCLMLFFMGRMQIVFGWGFLLFLGIYNTFGNFGVFSEVGTAALLDGSGKRIYLVPLVFFAGFFYLWQINKGFWLSIWDLLFSKDVKWEKTEHFHRNFLG